VDGGVGKRGGVSVERVRYGMIWTFRHGLVARMQLVDSRDDALKAVGLKE
jgi:hypothetical protein